VADQHCIDVPVLDLQARTVDPCEEKRRERGDFGFYEYTVNVYTVRIPFTGEAVVFGFRPNPFDLSPPRATLENNELLIVLEQKYPDATALSTEIHRTTSSIEKYLSWLREMVEPFNAQLAGVARDTIRSRKEKLGKDANVLTALGIPIRRRDAVPATVSVPIQRTPIPLPHKRAQGRPQQPDPTLSEAAYQQILKTMADMALVIERNPTAFEHLTEEQSRFQFLVPLNALYEGNATAETFSYAGKTDIQIRNQGMPIFTAECKFWTGEKSLLKAIDQLLSYTTWRDTKTAILLFNRQKDLSKIIAKLETTVARHPRFLRCDGVLNETQFRFVMSHPNDLSRHIVVTVLVFDIP